MTRIIEARGRLAANILINHHNHIKCQYCHHNNLKVQFYGSGHLKFHCNCNKLNNNCLCKELYHVTDIIELAVDHGLISSQQRDNIWNN